MKVELKPLNDTYFQEGCKIDRSEADLEVIRSKAVGYSVKWFADWKEPKTVDHLKVESLTITETIQIYKSYRVLFEVEGEIFWLELEESEFLDNFVFDTTKASLDAVSTYFSKISGILMSPTYPTINTASDWTWTESDTEEPDDDNEDEAP